MMPTQNRTSQVLTEHFQDSTAPRKLDKGYGTTYCSLCLGGGTAPRTKHGGDSLQMAKTKKRTMDQIKKDQIKENNVELNIVTEHKRPK